MKYQKMANGHFLYFCAGKMFSNTEYTSMRVIVNKKIKGCYVPDG